ncbi:hypothetical protein D3C80_2120970 [compost metagenome]
MISSPIFLVHPLYKKEPYSILNDEEFDDNGLVPSTEKAADVRDTTQLNLYPLLCSVAHLL